MNTFNLIPSKWKFKFNIKSLFSIMRQFIFTMLMKSKFFFIEPNGLMPPDALFFPMLEPFFIFPGLYKILHFHLFKFPRSKDKVSRRYFVSKCFSNLSNPKGNFMTHRTLHI